MSTAKNILFIILERHLIWAILAVLFLAGIAVPGFLSVRNILNVMWAAAPLGCMVLGLFFVVLTANVDLSLESTFALAPTLAVVSGLYELFPDNDAVLRSLQADSVLRRATDISFQVHSVEPTHRDTLRSIALIAERIAPHIL